MAKKRSSKASAKATKSIEPKSFKDTPWDGRIDDDELVRPGGPLLAMLTGRARQLGHTRQQMSKQLNVTYGYIAQLTSGHRSTENISDDFAAACARYLGVPKVTVLLAAGALKPEDFFEQPDEIETALPRAMDFIKSDPKYGPLLPPEVTARDASARLQAFVVRLYEGVTGLKFLPGEHAVENIVKALKEIDQRRTQLLKQAHG